MKKSPTVDEYILNFPQEVVERLVIIRELIFSLAPDVTENIAYGMPSYKYYGKPLLYIAGYEKHTGLYALPSGHEKFRDRLSDYKQGKGSVQFPHNKPLPIDLIEEIIRFRIDEVAKKPK